jgi:hypothetical protein
VIPGTDPTPWNLLHDGTIVRLERDLADEVSVWIDAPYVRARFPDGGTLFRFRLAACAELDYQPHDEPSITELAAIASSEPDIREAVARRDGIVVFGSAGSLLASYASLALELDTGTPLAIDELRRVVRAYWDEWRTRSAPVIAHPAIRAVLDGRPLRAALPDLLAAWRLERTSELAKAIVIVDERTRGATPARLGGPETCDAWCATWATEPGAALAELARRAWACWAELLAPDADYSAVEAAQATLWTGLARCAGALRSAAPDPRIGRALEDTFDSPSNNWFRIDQVHHAIGSFPKPNDDPSFADHALALLELHADAGTANRLYEQVNRLLIEADCNTAELAARLRELAARLAARYPDDTKLADEIAMGLRSRN